VKRITIRVSETEKKCSRCRVNAHDLTVDGIELCEECLVKAVLKTSGDPDAARSYEVRLLEGDLARLTGKSYRVHNGLNALPTEDVIALRRAIREIEDAKHQANMKLRRFGLPGV